MATTATATMPSYASRVAVATSPKPASSSTIGATGAAGLMLSPQTLSAFQQRRIKALSQPPPQSFCLYAALQLLTAQPTPVPSVPSSSSSNDGTTTTTQRITNNVVYLMDVLWLQNWFVWALHQQPCVNNNHDEHDRHREALRMAALQLGLVPPNENMSFAEPGPVDNLSLSVPGHPLLLNPCVQMWQQHHSEHHGGLPPPPLPGASANRRAISLQHESKDDNDINTNTRPMECIPVPQAFYECLRSTHGVVCEDGEAIAFQAFSTEHLILHHQDYANVESCPEPRPVEFRRHLLWVEQPPPSPPHPDVVSPHTLMEKLMLQDQPPLLLPVPEIHPLKIIYTVVTDDAPPQKPDGFCLISRTCAAPHGLAALLRVATNVARERVRLWSRTTTTLAATQHGDGYELVDLDVLRPKHDSSPVMDLQQWVQPQQHSDGGGPVISEVHVLVEVRASVLTAWPRHALELAPRLQVGDWVDAQDVAGHWYEAVVRKVDEQSVTVHYVGWNSRWDTKIKRYAQDVDKNLPKAVSPKLAAPTPLWSRVGAWRAQLQVDSVVEVRDTSSLVQRPKWYRGVIRKIGRTQEAVRPMEGGAQLELYDGGIDSAGNTIKEPLLILGRTQQVLVEVEQEKTDQAGNDMMNQHFPALRDAATRGTGGALAPRPPYLRWVSLYGEEICKLGTHLQDETQKGPVTLHYVYDGNRKPVEVMKALPTLGAGFMRESLRGVPPAPGSVGLHNLGNSCFLNSTVQCLNHIEPLTQYFLTDKYSKDLNRKNPLGSGGNVAVAYAGLLKKMWGGEYSVLAPRLLKQTVANFAPQFDNCYQHDSQEFCQFLMDGLHEDLNRVEVKPYVEELEGFGMDDKKAAIESWRKHLLRNDSIIVDHCQGMHRSHLTCPRCGRESIKFDIFSSISVPLFTEKNQITVKLEDCLEKFMEGEQLDERNAWYCPTCRQHVCALKMIALWTVPDILIIHLKRFTFGSSMTSDSMWRTKVGVKVDFPIEGFDLRKHVLGTIDADAPPVYRLFGVSEHSGPTANSGHYTATVRNSIDNQWYRCNDSHIGRTSGDAAITGGAYLLFYQRQRGVSKWGGMGRLMTERGVDPYGGLERDQDGFTKVKAKKKSSRHA